MSPILRRVSLNFHSEKDSQFGHKCSFTRSVSLWGLYLTSWLFQLNSRLIGERYLILTTLRSTRLTLLNASSNNLKYVVAFRQPIWKTKHIFPFSLHIWNRQKNMFVCVMKRSWQYNSINVIFVSKRVNPRPLLLPSLPRLKNEYDSFLHN